MRSALLYKEDDVGKIVKDYFVPLMEGGSILAFLGPLGVGKTTLIRACLRALGVSGPIQSPTFAYLTEYRRDFGPSVCHFDLYRIDSEEEFYSIGFDEILARRDTVFFIEWPEVISSTLGRICGTERVYKVIISYAEHDLAFRKVVCEPLGV